jgi:hypothetical protein
LGEPEFSARSRNATDSPNRPEVKQMMIVKPLHRDNHSSIISMNQ